MCEYRENKERSVLTSEPEVRQSRGVEGCVIKGDVGENKVWPRVVVVWVCIWCW